MKIITILIALFMPLISYAESVQINLQDSREGIQIHSNITPYFNLGMSVDRVSDTALVGGLGELKFDGFFVKALVGERIFVTSKMVIYLDMSGSEQAKHYSYVNEQFFEELSFGYEFRYKEFSIKPFVNNSGLGIGFGLYFR